ncbi:hypothetical protein H6F76_01650 [Leptolyngbya sp. FACHB-321]|uniref:hypothetical protein n=1 Tax=Leptolyngbya sp. FACHB-321 TaxID=2692807 RepID=UPI001686C38E|nr:hypothetical protein [Leptolyngbya sp. FACHB-321]MBD2033769.1 hypothetical protein [Leptolyngbya sp. FACHB-321]
MKYKIGTFLGLVLSTSLTVTAAYCQNPPSSIPSSTSSSGFNEGDVIDYRNDGTGKVIPIKRKGGVLKGLDTPYIGDQEFWLALGITVAAGILGGFVAELINLNGNIERPHKPSDDEWAARAADTSGRDANYKNVIDLGIFARLSIGGLAAPAAMVFLKPVSVFALFGTSVVAGSAGAAIFIALQERIKTVIAEQQKAVAVAVAEKEKEHAQEPARQEKLKQSAQLLLIKLNEAATKLEKIEEELRRQSETKSENCNILMFQNEAGLNPNDFKEVWSLLNEVKGVDTQIGDKITKPFKVLEQTINSLSTSTEGEVTITIGKGKKLDLEVLNQVKKHLNEAKGEVNAIAEDELISLTAKTPTKPTFQPASS